MNPPDGTAGLLTSPGPRGTIAGVLHAEWARESGTLVIIEYHH